MDESLQEAWVLHDMQYNGQVIAWHGFGNFRATSGMPYSQRPGDQCTPDQGPVPEGFYSVLLEDMGVAADDGTGQCNLRPAWGMQTIPRGTDAGQCEPYWANWGNNRVRMEPADSATRQRCSPLTRGGFYLHDSTKGYSHGCIEVEGGLFNTLRMFRNTTKKDRLILKVKYVEGMITNGDTAK